MVFTNNFIYTRNTDKQNYSCIIVLETISEFTFYGNENSLLNRVLPSVLGLMFKALKRGLIDVTLRPRPLILAASGKRRHSDIRTHLVVWESDGGGGYDIDQRRDLALVPFLSFVPKSAFHIKMLRAINQIIENYCFYQTCNGLRG